MRVLRPRPCAGSRSPPRAPPCAPQRGCQRKPREACVRRTVVRVTQSLGAKAHSVPCSTKAAGRNGRKAISSSSPPRAPATAVFEQRSPRSIEPIEELAHRPASRLPPRSGSEERRFKLSAKGLGANDLSRASPCISNSLRVFPPN